MRCKDQKRAKLWSATEVTVSGRREGCAAFKSIDGSSKIRVELATGVYCWPSCKLFGEIRGTTSFWSEFKRE